ncbi:unnamed protein product [Caenorhabditis brenneri]
MSNASYFTEPWQTREVIDPQYESKAYESIIDMIFGYGLPDICHIVMTNYTWKETDIHKLYPFYASLKLDDKLETLQKNTESSVFDELTKKFGDDKLPMYAKSVDSSRVAKASRVFHDAKSYLETGSAEKDELTSFVNSTLKAVLEPLFSAKEIKHVVKPLVSSLFDSQERDDEIGKDVERNRNYELMISLQSQDPGFPKFHENLSLSITNFIGYFALHTIRHYCYANFGVDGQLKFYEREMHKKAKEDLRTAKKANVNIKSEKSNVAEHSDVEKKPPKTIRIKPEHKDSDDDFCEVIEPKPANNSRKRTISDVKRESDMISETKEKAMLEKLANADLPTEFKVKLLLLVEENQRLREELRDYRTVLQFKMTNQMEKTD